MKKCKIFDKNSLRVLLALALFFGMLCMVGCDEVNTQQTLVDTVANVETTQPSVGDMTTSNMTQSAFGENKDDLYLLHQYNLLRRRYILAGKYEEVSNLKCEVERTEGYVYLFVEGVGCVDVVSIKGIVTPLNSYLGADSEAYLGNECEGIFFFDIQGYYHQWVGPYYYVEVYRGDIEEDPNFKITLNLGDE